ncbi:MAG: glycosyltransferase, partial [Nitrospirales bacterium]|nr:glycosyltransferase [Nitrospirales bacterium]
MLFCPIPEGPFLSPVPTVLVIHDLIPLRFFRDYPAQRLYVQWYVKPLVRRAKTIIAVSETTKADLMEYFRIDAEKIHVIPGGCDHELFHPGINAEKVRQKYHLQSYCLYVGNLHPHKNLARLIQAFHRVAGERSHQLVIVGKKDPRFYPALQDRVDRLGLHGKV